MDISKGFFDDIYIFDMDLYGFQALVSFCMVLKYFGYLGNICEVFEPKICMFPNLKKK
jgi:hypothetical protein